MYNCIYLKFHKRQNSSDGKQINVLRGLGVGAGTFESNKICVLIVVTIVHCMHNCT